MIYGAGDSIQVIFQAAEQLRQYGIMAPYGSVTPLIPLLLAMITSLSGVSTEQAYIAIILFVWISGIAAVYGILRRRDGGLGAAIMAVLFAVAPSRLLAIFDIPDASRLCFGTLAVVLVWLWTERRLAGTARISALILALLALMLTTSSQVDGLDVLALVEIIFALNFYRFRWSREYFLARTLPRFCLICTVFIGVSWLVIARSSTRVSQSIPGGVMAWMAENSLGARVYGLPSLAVHTMANRASIDRVIQSPGHENLSVRWLRTLGFEYLVSRNRLKFHSRLECVYEENEWCVYFISGANPAHAVVVSRYGRKNLVPIRGPLDIDSLLIYEAWSSRAEAAGLAWPTGDSVEINSDLGPGDLILFRFPIRMGWQARVQLDSSSGNRKSFRGHIKIEPDPMGFMILDPTVTGPVRIVLDYHPNLKERVGFQAPKVKPFIEGQFPRIYSGGIGDAKTFALSPFQPGTVVSIFGENFLAGDTKVYFGATEVDILYTDDHQINVRVPVNDKGGDVAVTVEVNGRPSHAHTVEVIK